MSLREIFVLVLLIVAVILLIRQRIRRGRPLEPAPRRILFPFIGSNLSQPALDAALRLCRAESATLVPAALARVPLSLSLESPQPRQAAMAMPVLDAVEQRALNNGVPVDSRIERGRSTRHALRELASHERYDRIVVAADGEDGTGLGPDDIAWLLDELPGEIVVLRPDRALRRGP
ncbi:MAG: universal stress protein, partial [Solirubrobacterales bacterium]|nr:universal stress protein [Solirubrobacterales bacterium]